MCILLENPYLKLKGTAPSTRILRLIVTEGQIADISCAAQLVRSVASVGRIVSIAFVLLVFSLLLTFPPCTDLLQGKQRAQVGVERCPLLA